MLEHRVRRPGGAGGVEGSEHQRVDEHEVGRLAAQLGEEVTPHPRSPNVATSSRSEWVPPAENSRVSRTATAANPAASIASRWVR